jgi:hypothetical protein
LHFEIQAVQGVPGRELIVGREQRNDVGLVHRHLLDAIDDRLALGEVGGGLRLVDEAGDLRIGLADAAVQEPAASRHVAQRQRR